MGWYLGRGIYAGGRYHGIVDEVGAESIRTRFFVFGLPILPLKSYYITRWSKEIEGMPIPLDLRSVAAGYLRWWLPFIAMLAFGILANNERLRPGACVVLGVSVG